MDSILNTIKKMLGIDASYSAFDQELIVYINGVFTTLFQLGVSKEPFRISGSTEIWDDYVDDMEMLESVKTYIYLKVRLLFDPPANSTVLNAFSSQAQELEWRLNVLVDPRKED